MSTPPDTEPEIEYLAWFRFPVTSAYLTGPPPEVEPEAAPEPPLASPALTLSPIAPALLSQDCVIPDAAGAQASLPSAISPARWEMMVPKMVRPITKSVALPAPIIPAAASASSPLAVTAKIPMS